MDRRRVQLFHLDGTTYGLFLNSKQLKQLVSCDPRSFSLRQQFLMHSVPSFSSSLYIMSCLSAGVWFCFVELLQ